MPARRGIAHLVVDPPGDAGPPAGTLVLLHAFPLGARMWEPQRSLAAHGWRLVMPQRRGFDSSALDGQSVQSIDDDAADVVDLLDRLEIERPVVCGLSMGGYVALALVRRAPERVRALVLADTRADADSAEARSNRARLTALARTDGVGAIADDMVPKLLGATTRAAAPDVERIVRALIASQTPDAVVSALQAMLTRPDSRPLLPAIAVPALVLVGEDDVLTPPPLAESMAAQIPGSEFALVPRAGHLSSLEQPVPFNAALLRFLNRL